MVGGIRFATWGLGINSTDWNVAAEKAAIRVHEANPNMLIIVGGIFTGGFIPAFLAPIRVPNQVSFAAFTLFKKINCQDLQLLSPFFL